MAASIIIDGVIHGSPTYTAMARILAVWENGVCAHASRPEEFYTNLTEAEKKRFKSL